MSTATSQRRTRPDMVVLGIGMAVVATVWALSCWWSFAEQTRAADSLHFRHPGVLPWMLDALAVALALVALASALTGQSAGTARLGVLLALGGSVWANTQGVSLRYDGHPEQDALIMAAIAPLSAFIALEVILGRIRRLVLWLRGEPAPAAIPALRLVRLVLDPKTSFIDWRRAVLERTAPTPAAAGSPVTGAAPGQQESTTPGPAPAVPPIDLSVAAHTDGSPTQGGPAVGSALPAPDAGRKGPPISPSARPVTPDPLTPDPLTLDPVALDPVHGGGPLAPPVTPDPDPSGPDPLTPPGGPDRRATGPGGQGAKGQGAKGQVNLSRLTGDQLVAHYLRRADPVLTVDQLASRLGVSKTTAKRRVRAARHGDTAPLRVVR